MKRILYTLIGIMLSTGAWADTLQEKINSATEATTIQLSQNVDLGPTTLIIPADKNITLDLNGYSITSSASGAVAVKNYGTLTVKDTSSEKAGKIISTKYAGIGAGDNSTTTFESGNIESVEGAIITGKAVGATITINGGTFSATDNAVIMGNGSARDGSANTITINGGTFNGGIVSTGYVACGIYAPWKDVITVNGGTFNITGGCGICARAGSVTVNGGEFNCTGTATGKVGDSRVVVPCSAIVYDSQAGYPAMTTESKVVVPSTSTAKFSAAPSVPAVSVVKNDGVDSHIEISGGTYSSPLTEDVCADGYIPSNTLNADGTYGAKEGTYVAQIGTTKYETLAEAFAAITDNTATTIEVLSDCSGNGIVVPSGRDITVNFNNHTYTVNTDVLAGSNGTKNQCFQLLRDSKVTFNNGKIVADNAAIKMIIQNYSDLTLTGMTIDATQGTNSVGYVVSNNNGNTVFGAGTTITAKDTGVAFDVYSFKNEYNYTGAKVTVDGATINGKIEVSAKSDGCDVSNLGLVLNSGTINGTITMGNRADEATVTKNESMTVTAPDGYKWDSDGKLVQMNYVAQIGETKYETLAEAITAAQNGETVTLISDVNESVENTNANNFTIDLNGKTWTSDATSTFKNNGGTVTITAESGNGTIKNTANAEDMGIAVWARTGNVIIDNGSFISQSNYEATVYVGTKTASLEGKQPSVTINGGSFKNTAEGVYKWNTNLLPLTLNVHNDISNADTYQAIVIKGGTFYGNDPSIGDDAQLNKINNNSNFVSSELHAEMKDGVFVIEEGGYVAQVGYLKYVTLTEAATKGDNITLLDDAEIETIDVVAGKTINKNGHELKVNTFEVIDFQACNIPFDFTANTAKYTRDVAGNEWGTVCVPFTLKSTETIKLYTFGNISGNVLTVNEVETAEPGTPVIFANTAKAASVTFTTENASVKATAPDTEGTLIGTYTAQTITENLPGNIYFINGDKFHQAQVSLTVPAYRAYIKNTAAGAKPSILSILVGGEATGVEKVSMENESVEGIYDVNGMKLSAPKKGMNIMKLANGKTVKLIVK